MIKKAQVPIGSVAFKGYGVARIQGKVVFIPHTMTGDEVWIEITEEKKKYSLAKLIQIAKPSPWRVHPPCPYFGRCGGCQWQHIDYSAHGELKKEMLIEILKRLGGMKEIPSIGVVPSPKPYNYRVRVQLKVKGKTMGFYQERSHKIVDINHCPISHPLVNQIIGTLREDLVALLRMKEIKIHVSPEEGRGVLLLHPLPFDQRIDYFAKEFLQSHPILKGIVLARKDGLNLVGNPHLHFTISFKQDGRERNLKLGASPESFFQVNLEQNQSLIQTVLNFSEIKGEESVLDLYAGVGNLTLPLATRGEKVLGIEENKTAFEDGRFNAARNGIKNCDFLHGRVEEGLMSWKKENPDLIVLDPPRTGCKTILDQMVRLKPKKIVYVSCDPTTFSRDLRLLTEKGYSLQKLGLIDMFPQTYHMEVVGLLTHPMARV